MLSTKVVGDVSRAKHYFLGQDNYYLKDIEGKEQSVWWGKGTETLGISGSVEPELFSNLLKGHLPDGQKLGIKVDGEVKHRAGYDLTFSVPKSVSLIALMTKDDEIRKAIVGSIWNAAKKTLDTIEHSCAQARIYDNGETRYVNTDNLVGALFMHDLSREADPQLHVHSVIMNMTQRSDGQWRSLASKSGAYGKEAKNEVNGFFERVRHNKIYFGTLFRAELAYELKQHHFRIHVVDREKGFFEVEGISDQSIKTYSTREGQIQRYMNEFGLSGAKAASLATLNTRTVKKHSSWKEINETWELKGQYCGIDTFKEVETVVNDAKNKEDQPKSDFGDSLIEAREVVQYAINYLSENQVKIKHIQLINFSVQQSLGKEINLSLIVKAIDELRAQGNLIPVEFKNGEFFYTSNKLLSYEQEIIRSLSDQIAGAFNIDPNKMNNNLHSNQNLTPDQIQAIKTIFQNNHRIHLLEGPSNTGKSALLKPMVEIVKQNGFDAIILAPNTVNKMMLKNDIRAGPNTVKHFLKNIFDTSQYATVSSFIQQQMKHIEEGNQFLHKRFVFVDDAQLLSTKQMCDLIYVSQKINARLIVIGDRRSLTTWQSGNPFQQMLEQGAQVATLQQVKGEGRRDLDMAREDTLKMNIEAAFSKIEHRILSVEDKEERLLQMAHCYLNLPSEIRNKTIVLMPTRFQCEEANQVIRDAIKKEKIIQTDGVHVSLLIPKALKSDEYKIVRSYHEGQWVRFNDDYASLNIARGEYFKIMSVHQRTNVIVLKSNRAKVVEWNPRRMAGSSGKIELFDEKSREISVGDRLICRRNYNQRDIFNGEKLKVLSITDQKMVLERENHKKISIPLKYDHARHFDYAYATTPYTGLTHKPEVIICYQNAHSQQSNQRLFYKVLSQAKQHVWIFTEDRKELLKKIQTNTGDKTTVIDVLLKHEKSRLHENQSQQEHIYLLEQSVAKTIDRLQDLMSYHSNPDKSPATVAKEAVKYALANLSEREAAFQHKDVMRTALIYALGESNHDLIREAVVQAENSGDLVRGIYSKDGTRWTTKDAIAMEREIIQLAKSQQGSLPPLLTKEALETHISSTNPKGEHAESLRDWLLTSDRLAILQGYAGTGKTTLLKNVQALLASDPLSQGGFELLCLAPTNSAVKGLKSLGLEAKTLDQFLVEQRLAHSGNGYKVPKFDNKLIIALDENSMTSNRRMRDFLRYINESEARAIAIGDKDQFPAIESGKPHTLLQSIGIKTVYLKEIVRQQNPTLLKNVYEIYEKKFENSFKTIEKHIVEIEDNAKRLNLISKDYLTLTAEERTQTIVITQTNKDRTVLNEMIREGLKEEGELYGPALETNILVPRDMTKIDLVKAVNYKADEIIRFGYTDPVLKVFKGDYLSIENIHSKENLLTLRKDNGERLLWQPRSFDEDHQGGVEVYCVKKREVMAGDIIRWTRSDKVLGLLSPELARVIDVDREKIYLHHIQISGQGFSQEGKPFEINHKHCKYMHWDHGRVITSYSAQSKSINNVLCNMSSSNRFLANQAAYLVDASRSINRLTFYIDDKESLLKKIIATPGDKTSALETIGEILMSGDAVGNQKKDDPSSFSENQSSDKAIKNVERRSNYFGAKEVVRHLHDRAESVVLKVLGAPKSKMGDDYQYSYSEQFGGVAGKDKGGSLYVAISGLHQGLWHSFKTNESGNMLQLIQKKFNLDFRQSLEYSAQILGLTTDHVSIKPVKSPARTVDPISKSDPKNWTKDQQKTVAYARRLARESIPVRGTLAERYLKEHRGISLRKMSDDIRFHPAVYSKLNGESNPALIAVARNEKGWIQAVQAIYLDDKTAGKADVNVEKQTWGVLSGSSVELTHSKQKSQVTYIAEGPETALSILQSIKDGNVKITLGKSNFTHPNLKNLADNVVLCLDNDGNNPQSDKLTYEAGKSFQDKEKQVWVAMPDVVKTDYNDMLKTQGEAAVKESIGGAIPFEFFQKNEPSESTLKSEGLEANAEKIVINKSNQKAYREHAFAEKKSELSKEISIKSPPERDKGMEQEMV